MINPRRPTADCLILDETYHSQVPYSVIAYFNSSMQEKTSALSCSKYRMEAESLCCMSFCTLLFLLLHKQIAPAQCCFVSGGNDKRVVP